MIYNGLMSCARMPYRLFFVRVHVEYIRRLHSEQICCKAFLDCSVYTVASALLCYGPI